MKKLSTVFCMVILFFFSCEQAAMLNAEINKETICSVDNPLEELDWLQAKIQTLDTSGYTRYFWVKQAELKGETVFIFGNCHPLWNSRFPVINCQGEEVCESYVLCNDPDEMKNETLIWKAQVSECFQ
jgi:hypothetical protein